jgi:hypothetical protein
MIVCIFEHVQWRWALNDSLARGERCLVQDVVQRAGDLGGAGRILVSETEAPNAY